MCLDLTNYHPATVRCFDVTPSLGLTGTGRPLPERVRCSLTGPAASVQLCRLDGHVHPLPEPRHHAHAAASQRAGSVPVSQLLDAGSTRSRAHAALLPGELSSYSEAFVEELETLTREHHTIDRLEERGVELGSAGRSCLKGRERAIASQMNITTDLMTAFPGNV